MTIEKLEHRLQRLKKLKERLEKYDNGNSQKYSYYSGFTLGNLNGQILVLEEFIEFLTDNK